jgi:flagellin-like hook-associated protein FlgL
VKGRIYDEFQSCLENLTNILSSKFFNGEFYFHGSQPTSIDAYLFGFLAPILHIDTPVNNLKSYIKNDSSVLARFCENITQSYFLHKSAQINFVLNEDDTETNAGTKSGSSNNGSKSKPNAEDQQRKKENILFLGGSALAILGYMAFQFVKKQADGVYYEDEYEDQ